MPHSPSESASTAPVRVAGDGGGTFTDVVLEQEFGMSIRPDAGAVAYRQIHLVRIDARHRILGDDTQFHIREGARKDGDARQQPEMRKGDCRRDRQFVVAPFRPQLGDGIGDQAEGIAGGCRQQPALLRQFDPAMQPSKQRKAEIFLEQMDLPADGSLCYPQLRRSARKTRQPRRGLEGGQSGQRRQLLSEVGHAFIFPLHPVMPGALICAVVL